MTNSREETYKDWLIEYQHQEIEELRLDIFCKDKEIGSLKAQLQYSPKFSEVSKLKIFLTVFYTLATKGSGQVNDEDLIANLIQTSQFIEDEARTYIKKAVQNGQIYERKSGILARA